MSVVRKRARSLGITDDFYQKSDIHIHLPEGAIPKDGPSAGIGLCTALVSVLTGIPVRCDVAMTGEITLRGKVMPVGGIKEKILAAKRAGLKEIIMCVRNQKDVEQINPAYIKGMKFHFVKTLDEVVELALMKQRVKNGIDIAGVLVKEEKKN